MKVTPEMVAQALRDTDWRKLDAQTDADIAQNVAGDEDAPPLLNAAGTASAIVRLVRARLGLSQSEFAARFQLPVGTLRDWEQNRKQPDASAIAYLRVIAKEPEIVAKALVT
jgi:putative transcriptional regulator